MGNWIYQARKRAKARKAKARSDAIDIQIEEDSKQFKRECKILLLGLDESGKSTILKQMRIITMQGFPDAERATYRNIVYRNVIDSAQAVIVAMRELCTDSAVYESNRTLVDKITSYRLDETTASTLFWDIANTIHQFWEGLVMSKVISEHDSTLYRLDDAFYFLSHVLRIGSPNYLPTETDILRAQHKCTKPTENRFSIGQLSLHIFDIGNQRSERRKWIHCFESVTSIFFCTSLSEYDQSEMTDSLILFESIINSRWFLRTSILLFLTNLDVLKRKLPKISLERYFPEYSGGDDVNKAAKYILWKFMQANRARLSVYPHLTQLTDISTIHLAFAGVKETILQNALKDSGIL
ncbi:heterotrimeric G-protein alpha subunit, GPA3-like protein [Rhodocollybia butyracea]|uniref:Heterotrimeric G-protein alpha subunit, GPA3-like protein n=1 Tax=Rhodocollybia butyracea TaxID=206335 RepID=A0A9P5Q1Y7_9AGAR|nr:heterotrimeric G-protein alpha subunit, GPA3-like protein [Rhodocollybia butyracea]